MGVASNSYPRADANVFALQKATMREENQPNERQNLLFHPAHFSKYLDQAKLPRTKPHFPFGRLARP
jgi:hypothetical protein